MSATLLLSDAPAGTTGTAHVKAEYVLPHRSATRGARDDDAAETATSHVGADGAEPPGKKLKGAARKRAAREKQQGGSMNHGRKFNRMTDTKTKGVCHAMARGATCERGDNCKFSHSIDDFLASKPADLSFLVPPHPTSALNAASDDDQMRYLDAHYATSPPFVLPAPEGEAAAPRCPAFEAHAVKGGGEANGCPAGWKCRFLSAHVETSESGERRLKQVQQRDFVSGTAPMSPDELNYVKTETTRSLSKRAYPLPMSRAALAILQNETDAEATDRRPFGIDAEAARAAFDAEQARKAASAAAPAAAKTDIDFEELENAMSKPQQRAAEAEASGSRQGAPDFARIRAPEKRRLDWKDKLYLAPLTTTGNLPFRRLCVTQGADITCGEMGLADSYLQGSSSEWSLARRWEGERQFGVQLCGSKPALLVPAAEALQAEIGGGLDFVDINCGCPIDMIYGRGAGSALLDAPSRLSRIVRGVSAVMGETPVTVKLRTGTSSTRTVHKLFPRLSSELGVGAATLHGRSRQQRYKNEADWSYIGECVRAYRDSVRAHNEEATHADQEEMHEVPIFGDGDVYDYKSYHERRELSDVDGVMIARGALIKPWIFTEIKERRDWDISSRERLDLVRQYAEWGLTHWGSDTQGVQATRRFLCEYLSFTSRYVPLGLLEHRAKMNDRPPAFRGRDELETLLASDDSQDWVRISELFLGPTPDEWTFVPKHKSNSYADGGGEQQG